jgi:hypothetical protein
MSSGADGGLMMTDSGYVGRQEEDDYDYDYEYDYEG